MDEETNDPPAHAKPPPRAVSGDREARRASALRANLRRRKAAAKAAAPALGAGAKAPRS